MSLTKQSNIFTIPPTTSFTDALAKGLMNEVKDTPEKLPSYLILLPTRRACRNVQEAFLRQSNGTPIMLPRLHPIGDIDEEELFLGNNTSTIEKIPPAIPTIKRQILLSRLITKLSHFSKGIEQDIRLASTLGQLMDQIYTEGLNLSDLPHIVDREAFADHWQVTVSFLEILSLHWPEILKEKGVIDAADRRNRLINALHEYWQQNPPDTPVIAAGTTGSIPATTQLLSTISTLPQGCIILPGLDNNLPDKAWDIIEEGHPQNTLKELLVNLEYTRADVQQWPHIAGIPITTQQREKFLSHAMAPAGYTHEWQKIKISTEEKTNIKKTLKKVQRFDCKTPQEEAQIIAILLRETLTQTGKTAALITPNRHLARRVAVACQRWGIDIDDSGGQPLSETAIGIYLKLIMATIIQKAAPVSLLALLKHNFCTGAEFPNFRSTVRKMDSQLMRGCLATTGFKGLHAHYNKKLSNEHNRQKPAPEILALIHHLDSILTPLIEKLENNTLPFSEILKSHLEIAETLASTQEKKGEDALWKGEAGEEAASFLSDFQNHIGHIPKCNATDYLAILNHFMQTVSVRPKYGTHPRLMILGQLEARLIQTDRIIMAGLNEGSWPPDPGHDPWMSRPMRVDFGLPKPERAITLAAHDFAQGFCGKEIFLTRSIREEGTPTVPSRWLQRIDTCLKAININPEIMQEAPHLNYVELLDKVEKTESITRPAPTPPITARPNHLSITKIETWMKDPYAIYAGSILKLRALEPLEKEIGAAERGNILHTAMEEFTKIFPNDVPNDAKNNFVQITHDLINKEKTNNSDWNFWMPRMERLAEWLIPHEQKWRNQSAFGKSEIKGEITITKGLNKPFILNGRADRIDLVQNGGTALIDYKSGGTYSVKKIEQGHMPQLPLEALIVNHGGFAENGITDKSVSYISYWKMTGGAEAGKIIALDNKEKLEEIIERTENGLTKLIHTYEDKTIPYLALPRLDNSPRFNDYEHLERVKEWAALDEGSEEVA